MSEAEDIASWFEFAFSARYALCWWCGRRGAPKPNGWGGPWMIERAHIVNKPRRKDRRVAALLCSRCHKVQHGDRIYVPGEVVIQPSVGALLFLKRTLDVNYYDRDYLQANCLGLLPDEVVPGKVLFEVKKEVWPIWYRLNWSKVFISRSQVQRTIAEAEMELRNGAQ